ncbi:MAG TPA: DUF5317 family protein [Actinomycetota bacterium]
MRLVLLTLPIGVFLGLVLGGRIGRLASLPVRAPLLALIGIALQFVPATGTVGAILLVASFVFLCAFAIRNLKLPGFPLILLGLVLNLTVIAVNNGMPVTRHALVRSGQASTLHDLQTEGGTKHHLATADDELLPLADELALPPPVSQAISVGDIATHAGIVWLIVWGMLRVPPPPVTPSEPEGDRPEPRLVGSRRSDP